VISTAKDGKSKATADCCASFAAVAVHCLIKQAGSFIPLHL
jgi:hypothetical protein